MHFNRVVVAVAMVPAAFIALLLPTVSYALISAMPATAPLPPAPPATTKKAYSLNELMQLAVNQNFVSREEWAKLLEAHFKMKRASELYPQITLNTITRLFVPTPESIARSAGDLLPFLLPNRWARRKESKALELAQFDGWILSKIDAAYNTEQLYYSILAQTRSLHALNVEKSHLQGIYRQIRSYEKSFIDQAGTSSEIQRVIDQVQLDVESLQGLVQTNLQSLSQAVGFDDPHTITDLIDDGMLDDSAAKDLIPSDLVAEAQAIGRSIELNQLEAWQRAVSEDTKARYFDWLDPEGSPDGGLGLGYEDYINVDHARSFQIEAQITLETSQLRLKVDQSISRLRTAQNMYKEALAAQSTDQLLVTRYLADMRLGLDFEMASLREALTGLAQDAVMLVQASVAAASSKAQLDRLELEGAYASFANYASLWRAFEHSSSSH